MNQHVAQIVGREPELAQLDGFLDADPPRGALVLVGGPGAGKTTLWEAFNLPLGAIASHDAPTSLPQRNLLRHLTWQLPSGQSVARKLGVTELAAADLQELATLGVGFERSMPLWYYVLKEAEVVADGLHLGPVGGRIVAEVFIGPLQADPGSYLAARPDWTPSLPSKTGQFRMTDFLTFAGVDPGSRGQ